MKAFTQRNMMILDLVLVTVFGLSVWHMPMSAVFPFSLVLLRLFATFSLQDKRKSNWMPIAMYSLWMIIVTIADNAYMLEEMVLNPVLRIVKVFLAFFGCSELGLVDDFDELCMNTPQIATATILTILLSMFYYFWLLFYPIVVYVRQWRKKEFSDNKWMNGSFGLMIGYAIAVIILMIIAESGQRYLGFGRYNVWLFFMSGLPLVMYLKERKPLTQTFKVYAVIVTIFYCAYVIGEEMDYYPSLVGLLLLPSLFYYAACKYKGIQIGYKDWCILLFAGMSFWVAQYGWNWLRILLLTISAVAYGYEVHRFFKHGHSKKLSVGLFLVIAFLLPTLTIGYN